MTRIARESVPVLDPGHNRAKPEPPQSTESALSNGGAARFLRIQQTQPNASSWHRVLALQRSHGNQYVARMLKGVAPPIPVIRKATSLEDEKKESVGVQRMPVRGSGSRGLVQRSPALVIKDKGELHATMLFRGELLFLVVRPEAETLDRFDADPALLGKIDKALTSALAP